MNSASSRTLVVAAVVLAAISIVSTAALGTLPAAAETGEQVVAWLRGHGATLRWFVFAGTISAPLLAVVVALLTRLLPKPHAEVFLIGGVSVIVAVAIQGWFLGGLALHADTLEPATARALLDVADYFGPVLTGAWMTMSAPVTVVALRGGLPRWLGVVGVVAFAEQAIETMTIFGSSGFTEPGGAMNL
jgi:hypothetical protein